MNYAFGCEFQELTQGSRNEPAFHGQATLARWRLGSTRMLRFGRQSSFWRPRWFVPPTRPFQERLGGRIALITEIDMPERKLASYNLHLESRGDDDVRISQLNEALADARRYAPEVPGLLAGDLNFDVSRSFQRPRFRKWGSAVRLPYRRRIPPRRAASSEIAAPSIGLTFPGQPMLRAAWSTRTDAPITTRYRSRYASAAKHT